MVTSFYNYAHSDLYFAACYVVVAAANSMLQLGMSRDMLMALHVCSACRVMNPIACCRCMPWLWRLLVGSLLGLCQAKLD